MVSHISRSPEDTEAVGESLVRALPLGSVVGLSGDLGAGKTQFVRGFARGLGVTERVHSPTFALLNIYTSGQVPLHHIDLYRLDSDDQIIAAGLIEYFEPDGYTIIEWIERWHGRLPARFQRVDIESINETVRRIIVHDTTGD